MTENERRQARHMAEQAQANLGIPPGTHLYPWPAKGLAGKGMTVKGGKAPAKPGGKRAVRSSRSGQRKSPFPSWTGW